MKQKRYSACRLDGLRFARRRRRQDWRDVVAQASVVAVRPLVDLLGLRSRLIEPSIATSKASQKVLFAGAVGTADQGDVMAEVESPAA